MAHVFPPPTDFHAHHKKWLGDAWLGNVGDHTERKAIAPTARLETANPKIWFVETTLTGYSPVWPSTASRRRSAWPLWRAYSSIRCTRIQRSDGASSLPCPAHA